MIECTIFNGRLTGLYHENMIECTIFNGRLTGLYHENMIECTIFNGRLTGLYLAGPRSAVGNVSAYRCESACRFRGHEFDPGPVPYFRGYRS